MLAWWTMVAVAQPVEGHFVYEPFVQAVEESQASGWHPNRIVPELHVAGDSAVLDFHGPTTCAVRGEREAWVLLCDGERHAVRQAEDDDTLLVDLPSEEGARFRRSPWTVLEWYRARRIQETVRLAPGVEGRWRRGERVLDLSASTAAEHADAWDLVSCHDGDRTTVCLRTRGDDGAVFALRDGQLVPVMAMPEHTCGEDTHDVDLAVDRLFVVEDGDGAPWVREPGQR